MNDHSNTAQETSELLLCNKCRGNGKRCWDELVNHHKGEYETHVETCPFCLGSGRRIKKTKTIVEWIPYTE